VNQLLFALFFALLLALVISILRDAIRTGEFSIAFDSVLAEPFALSRKRHPTFFWLTVFAHALAALAILFALAGVLRNLLGV
jgi:hypothetical protein